MRKAISLIVLIGVLLLDASVVVLLQASNFLSLPLAEILCLAGAICIGLGIEAAVMALVLAAGGWYWNW